MERIDLTSNSFLLCGNIPFEVDFNSLYYLKPSVKDSITAFGKRIELPRYHRGFIKEYKLPGDLITIPGNDLPSELVPFLDFVNTLGIGTFNQCLMNFYDDGKMYIGFHTDSLHTPVFSASFGAPRIFRITDQKTRNVLMDIEVKDKSFLIMCGDFQKELFHEILQDSTNDKRINITFRQL
jgi:alkylated DNA repair dioxygenase AlkB